MMLKTQNFQKTQTPLINEMLSIFTQQDLCDYLARLDFEVFIPRCNTWKHAFILSTSEETLLVLIRKSGVDLRVYSGEWKAKLDNLGQLYLEDGLLIYNYYYKADVMLNQYIAEAATSFFLKGKLDEIYKSSVGKSNNVRKADKRREASDALDLYDAICIEDGEDVYLGDGLWITSSGSTEDRGR